VIDLRSCRSRAADLYRTRDIPPMA
jgi:hypothetical protein